MTRRSTLRILFLVWISARIVEAWSPPSILPAGWTLPTFGAPSSQEKMALAQEYLAELMVAIDQAPANGINTPPDLEAKILSLCQELENCNPTSKPARDSQAMNGFWKMLWTNFAPAAPSSGQLGPLVGTVYQDLNFDYDTDGTTNTINGGVAKNILKIDFPPIAGALVAAPSLVDDSTVAIAFEKVGNKLAGVLPLGPTINFEPNQEIRLWEHVYLDDTYRIFYARRREEEEGIRGFLYVMTRADEDRFDTGI